MPVWSSGSPPEVPVPGSELKSKWMKCGNLALSLAELKLVRRSLDSTWRFRRRGFCRSVMRLPLSAKDFKWTCISHKSVRRTIFYQGSPDDPAGKATLEDTLTDCAVRKFCWIPLGFTPANRLWCCFKCVWPIFATPRATLCNEEISKILLVYVHENRNCRWESVLATVENCL